MRILHFGPIGSDRLTGLCRSIPALVQGQREVGAEVCLVTTDPRGPYRPESDGAAAPAVELAPRWWFGERGTRSELRSGLARGDWDLVVFHSTYIPAHWGVAAFLRKGSIPYVVTPRSGMTAGARALKRWKKRAGDLLGFRRMVRGARAVHYLTEVERANSPRWCASSFVVGNGVDLPEWDSVRDRVREEGVIRCLFIGRYAIRAKGLDRLLDAVEILHRSENTPAHPRWQVTLRGRGTPRDEQWLRHEIQTRNLDERVELGGPVADREKKELFSKADIFIHVSRFEGEPMAVLEALAHGVPAIVTEGTGLAEPLVRAKAGWRVGETGSIIADQLSRFEPARIPAYGRNARTFAESRSWNNQAAKTLACYQVMNRLLVVPELYYPEQ